MTDPETGTDITEGGGMLLKNKTAIVYGASGAVGSGSPAPTPAKARTYTSPGAPQTRWKPLLDQHSFGSGVTMNRSRVRIMAHRAHGAGHAALFVEECGVLVAGDMLSDVLIPMLDVNGDADPIAEYFAALQLFDDAAGEVEFVIPGHGAVGGAEELRARIDRDRVYVQALRDGRDVDDPRIGPPARTGWEWVSDVHAGQLQRLNRRS